MNEHKTDFWDRLKSFAKGIKLDTLSIGPAQFRFTLSEEQTPAFAQIRERIDSLRQKKSDVFVLSAHNVDEVTVVDRIDAARNRVESAAGAVAVGRGVCCCPAAFATCRCLSP